MDQQNNAKGPIRTRFEVLDMRRRPMLDRCREFAELSIPSILPKDKQWETDEMPVPFSSITARNASRLASRISSTLVPLNNLPFFNLEIDEATPVAGHDSSEETKVMSRIERRIMSKLATTNFRQKLYTAILACEVVGQALLLQNENYNFSSYRLDNYVVRRRPDGEWAEIVYRWYVDPTDLPEMLTKAGFQNVSLSADATAMTLNDDNAVYNRITNDFKGGCKVTREYRGREVDAGTHVVCPYTLPHWTLVDGENYARGLVEDNCGDIRAVEVMAEALLDSIAANAEYRFGVNPAGLTEIHDLQSSSNGAFVPAVAGDVFPIQLGSQAQVTATQASVSLKEQSLNQVFLSNTSVQRTAERVTAAEIRLIASELEQALGGVFSDAARTILIPIVKYTMYRMIEDNILVEESDQLSEQLKEELTSIDGLVKIKVKTGLESLSREADNERVERIMDRAQQLPQQAQDTIKWPGLINRWFSSAGLEPEGLVMSAKEYQAQQVAAQQQQMQMAAQQQAIQSTGNIAEMNAQQQSEVTQ